MKDVYSEFQKGSGDSIDVQAFLSALKQLSLSDMSIPLPSFLSKLQSLKEQIDNGLLAGPDGMLSDALSGGVMGGLGVGGVLGQIGDDLVMQLFQVADGMVSGALDKITGALLSQINFPEAIFLETIKALYSTGADQNFSNKYLRKIALEKDLIKTLKWLDGVDRVTYDGSRHDSRVKDGVIAGSNSGVRVVNYILNQISSVRKQLGMLSLVEERDINYRDNIVEEITISMHEIFKELLVNSYTNVTVSEIANMIKLYGIIPRAFGDNDVYFSKKFNISKGDINKMAPFYSSQNGAIDYMSDVSKGFNQTPKQYIDVRNNNIKRIYLYMNNKQLFGSDRLVHNDLAIRLSHETISTAGGIMDNALNSLVNAGIPQATLDGINNINSSIFTFTKSVEKTLYDPSKIQYLRFSDQIPMPTKPTPDEKDIEETMEVMIVKLRNASDGTTYPSDFDEFFAITRLEYRTLEMSNLINNLMIDVANGTISEAYFRAMSIVEELYDRWNVTGSLELLTLNYRSILPILITHIKDGTYTSDYMTTHTLRQLILEVKADLEGTGDYDEVLNVQDTTLYFTYIYKGLYNDIENIILGNLLPADVKSFDEYYLLATEYVDGGDIPTLSMITDVDRYMLDSIQESHKAICNNDIEYNMFPNNYLNLKQEAENAIATGYKVPSGMNDYLIDLRENIRNILIKLQNGSIVYTEVLTFTYLSNLAAQTSGASEKFITTSLYLSDMDQEKLDKLSASLVNMREQSSKDVLNSPIDTTTRDVPSAYSGFDSSDSEQYWANMDKIVDQDPTFFDFDVLNPSSKNYESITREIIEAKGGKLGQVVWIKPTYTTP